MSKKTKVRLMFVIVSLILFAVWAALPVSETALAKKPDKPGKPGGGGGGINYDLARIHFAGIGRIQSDGQASCTDATRPGDPVWDYWDQHDTTLTDQNNVATADGIETSVSGGGRLFFFTVGRPDFVLEEPNRWLVLDLTPNGGDDGAGPNIDDDVYGSASPDDPVPPINESTYVDNLKCTIKLDVMFKKRATRQPLVIEVRKPGPAGGWAPSGWVLRSVEDLYIIQDPSDKDVRTLATGAGADEDVFELIHNGAVVGTYGIPLSWTMRLVDAP